MYPPAITGEGCTMFPVKIYTRLASKIVNVAACAKVHNDKSIIVNNVFTG
jgi:hypothetical protein